MMEVEIVDIVKKMRTYINALDNVHLLSSKIGILGDTLLSQLATKIMAQVDNAAADSANLLRHIENSVSYKNIVKKYKTPSPQPEESEDSEEEEEIDGV